MPAEKSPVRDHVHFLIVFLLISFNLRMSFAAANPLLVFLMKDLGLDITDSSLFALLPVMILGVAAPIGSRLTAFIRPRVLIIYALTLAMVGVVWRSYGGITGLFAGTAFIGLGLGITGSVILGVVKEIFPKRSPEMMGAYTACISLGTAIGSGTADPIAIALGGWQLGLLFWGLPLLLATILWAELTFAEPDRGQHHIVQARIRPLLRNRKAWMITLYYVTRVAGAWLLIVWIATLMRQRGLPLEEAGIILAINTAFMIPSSVLYLRLEHALGGRKPTIVISIITTVIASSLLLNGPVNYWPLFTIFLGLGLGALFTLGMTLIVDSSADSETTIALSGMSQGIGFIIGGLLAWASSLVMNLPHHHIWVSVIYASFSLIGLYFALQSTRPELVDLKKLEANH